MPGNPHPSPFKSRGGPRRIFSAARYSCSGFKAAFRHEAAFRQELLLVILLLPCALWLGRSVLEVAALIVSLLLVLVVELLNSAVEAVADAVSIEWHPLLGRAKDLGSAAVMLAILCAAGVWGSLAAVRIMDIL